MEPQENRNRQVYSKDDLKIIKAIVKKFGEYEKSTTRHMFNIVLYEDADCDGDRFSINGETYHLKKD